MKPLVSILIPAFNMEVWIADTLQSAIAQTWPRKEIIVVDDGSTDRTAKVARRFASKEVAIISTQHLGCGAARNRAYQACQGDYIQYLDADDLLAPDKIERQIAALQRGVSKRTLLSSPWAHFYHRTHRARFFPTPLWQDLSPVEWLLRKVGENLHMQPATWLTSRELAEASGPWNTSLLVDDDGEYFCRVLLVSEGTHFVPEAKVFYRVSSPRRVSYIGTSDKKKDSLFLSMRLHIQYLRSLEESDRVRKACLTYLQNWYENFYPERTDIVAELQGMAAELHGRLEEPRLRPKYAWMKPLFGWKVAKFAQRVLPQRKASTLRGLDRVMYKLEAREEADGLPSRPGSLQAQGSGGTAGAVEDIVPISDVQVPTTRSEENPGIHVHEGFPVSRGREDATSTIGYAGGSIHMKPLVSILIPAYNMENWISETLHSAVAQTWPRKEIIVLDDGSTDQTAEKARRFASKGVTVVSTENHGVAAACNEALRLSQGDYIQWLAADDLLAPDKIERQLAARKDTGDRRKLLSSPWAYFYYRTYQAQFVPTSLWQDLSPVEWLLRKMGENLHMQPATWLTSRELAEAAGPEDARLYFDDDGEYFCRVLLASEGTHFVPDARVYYRVTTPRRVSYIGTSDKKKDSLLLSMKLHIKYLRSLEESDRVRKACLTYLQNWYDNFYPERQDIVAEMHTLAAELQGRLEEPRLRPKYAWMKPIFGWKTAKLAQRVLPQWKSSVLREWDKTMYRLEAGGKADARDSGAVDLAQPS